MATITLNVTSPTVTSVNTYDASSATGTLATRWSDASDVSYTETWTSWDGVGSAYQDRATGTVDTLTLPGGATVTGVTLNFRAVGTNGSPMRIIPELQTSASVLYMDFVDVGGLALTVTGSAANYSHAVGADDLATGSGVTLSSIVSLLSAGGAKLMFDRLSNSGDPTYHYALRVHEASVVVTYTPAPVNNAHCGTKVIRYTVDAVTSLPYRVSPLGPAGDLHHGAFKIADVRTVSAMFSLGSTSSQDFYVQPQARYLAWDGLAFTVVSVANLGSQIHMVGNNSWTTATRTGSAPDSATHWYLDFAVLGNAAGAAPSIGTILYLDCVYVPDNGLDVAAEPYLDGDQVGTIRGDGRWEGVAHDSTSVWGALVIDPDPAPPPTDPGGDTGGTDAPPDTSTDVPLPDPGFDPDPTPVVPEDNAAWLVTHRDYGKTFCLTGDVQLGDHHFNIIDDFGVFWVVNEIDGWWTLPDPDIPDITRGNDDGSYDTRGRYNARVMTLTGSFFPPSDGKVRDARGRLIVAANLCHLGAWFATHEEDATRASKVWLSGQLQMTTINKAGRTDFSIGLKAPDPIKYGLFNRELPGWNTVLMASATVAANFGRVYDRTYPWGYPLIPSGGVVAAVGVATNDGNVRVSPVITVTGPTLGPLQIHSRTTLQTTRVRAVLQANDVLVIDCQNRSVTLNGVPNKRLMLDVVTDWIYLEPGPNTMYYTEETGSSASLIKVEWRSGWIG